MSYLDKQLFTSILNNFLLTTFISTKLRLEWPKVVLTRDWRGSKTPHFFKNWSETKQTRSRCYCIVYGRATLLSGREHFSPNGKQPEWTIFGLNCCLRCSMCSNPFLFQQNSFTRLPSIQKSRKYQIIPLKLQLASQVGLWKPQCCNKLKARFNP